MVKTPGRRLKVFQTRLGFFDSVVAAPSRAAALRAWGVHQNLFADGRAAVAEEAEAVAAALLHPGTPLRRAVGSRDPFAIEAAGLPAMPDAPKRAAARPKPKEKAPTPRKPPADRSALAAAEAALRRLDEDRKGEQAALRRRQDDLDAEREAAQAAYVARRKTATAAVAGAREAYRKAGGGN